MGNVINLNEVKQETKDEAINKIIEEVMESAVVEFLSAKRATLESIKVVFPEIPTDELKADIDKVQAEITEMFETEMNKCDKEIRKEVKDYAKELGLIED